MDPSLKIDLIVEWINSTTNQDHKKETIDTLGSAGTSLCMAMDASSNEIGNFCLFGLNVFVLF